jgi:hypothetical protein
MVRTTHQPLSGALEKSVLHEEWLVDLLERPDIFADRRSDRTDTDRAAVDLTDAAGLPGLSRHIPTT